MERRSAGVRFCGHGQGSKLGRHWKLISIGALALLVIAFFTLLAYGLANRTPATGRSGVTRIGKPAPPFSMTLLGGGEFRLEDHAGSPLVINFWASWCPPCRDESPGFERVWRKYRESGVQFVGVDIQDTEAEAARYMEEFGLTFPNGRDPDGKITVEYGVIGLPVTFFVGANGVVEGRWVGAVPEDKLEERTRALIDRATLPEDSGGETADGFFLLR